MAATAQHQLQYSKIKVKKGLPLEKIEHTKSRKIGDSLSLSLFICNSVVCETAYAS